MKEKSFKKKYILFINNYVTDIRHSKHYNIQKYVVTAENTKHFLYTLN